MPTLSKSQFKPRALALFREVEATGQPLILTDHGRPVIRIEAYSPPGEDPLAAFRGCVRRLDDPCEPVAVDDWEALGGSDSP